MRWRRSARIGRRSDFDEERIREQGLDPAEPRLAQALALARELIGFPRHLSQHVGGFVNRIGDPFFLRRMFGCF